MTVNQISIFLENKYGKLSEILALLAEERIRIIAATVADTSEYGILRIIVSDPQKAYKILKENNVSANLTDVLAIVTSSCAGSFANTLSYFTKAVKAYTSKRSECSLTTSKAWVPMEPVEPNIANCLFFMDYQKAIYSSGFTGLPLYHNSKCRCGPVDNSPVFPTRAIASPATTWSPTSFSNNSLCL